MLMLSVLTFTPGAQVPAGMRFDPEVHPNPVVTFVTSDVFHTAGYDDASSEAGIELLGLSNLEGTRTGISLAPGHTLELRIVGRRTEVLTFPVVLQTFELHDGALLELYSFRNPRTTLPSRDEEAMLNTEAFTPPREPGEGRFGPVAMPDGVSVRGREALLFNAEEQWVLFWQEDGTSHVAVSGIDEEDLIRIVEDLL